MNQGQQLNEAIEIFCGITGGTPGEANRFLTMAKGDVNTAVGMYYAYEDELMRRRGVVNGPGAGSGAPQQRGVKHKEEPEGSSTTSDSDSFYDEPRAPMTGGNNAAPRQQAQGRGANIVGFGDLQAGNQQAPKKAKKAKKQVVKKRKPLFEKRKSSKTALRFKSIMVGLDLTKQMKVVTTLNKEPPSDYKEAVEKASAAHKPLIVFVHAPCNNKSKAILKAFEAEEVEKLLKKRFIFYATSIYHDEFDELISIGIIASSKPAVQGVQGGIINSITNINGIQDKHVTDGFIEYPYIGVVMPLGVDGIHKPKRIQNSLLETKALVISTLKQIIGSEGPNRIATDTVNSGVHSPPFLSGVPRRLDEGTSLVDDSCGNESDNEVQAQPHATTNTNVVEAPQNLVAVPFPQSTGPVNKPAPQKNDTSDSSETTELLEYALRNASGKYEVLKFDPSATVGNLFDAALLFIRRVEDETATLDRISIICRSQRVNLTSSTDMDVQVETVVPSHSSLIVVFAK